MNITVRNIEYVNFHVTYSTRSRPTPYGISEGKVNMWNRGAFFLTKCPETFKFEGESVAQQRLLTI